MNEVIVLIEIRYRNIVKFYGYCLYESMIFLVYEYMEKGGLVDVLCSRIRVIEFDWEKRVRIIKGVVDVLVYMYYNCVLFIVYRDILSKNILLCF